MEKMGKKKRKKEYLRFMALKLSFVTELRMPANWIIHPLQISSGAAMLKLQYTKSHIVSTNKK
jgi:hypothetical protein